MQFISILAKLLELFHKLLKKYAPFCWGEEEQAAFQKVKDVLNSPLTMISPVKGSSLTLYLTYTNKPIGAFLAQEIEGVKHLGCYLSRSLRCAEMNYSSLEYHYSCLSVLLEASRLLNLVTKSNPLKHLLSRPAMSIRDALWLLQLKQFELIGTPRRLRTQASRSFSLVSL